MRAPEVPVWALTHLTHAALQRTADRVGADVLHIKGPSTLRSLRMRQHDSTDADVLVRPAHLSAFIAGMQEDGWQLFTDFDEGSPFGHAANFTHPSWTYADIHHAVPGPLAAPDAVFERLWTSRQILPIGNRPCTVLSLPAQVLMQSLHSARSHGLEPADAWTLCPDDQRDAVRALAAELKAETAFAAGIGELDAHRDAPDHALWAYWSAPEGDRLDEWQARLRSASTFSAKLSVLRQALRVNRTHLRLRLEREPSRGDVAREQAARAAHAARSIASHVFRRFGRSS